MGKRYRILRNPMQPVHQRAGVHGLGQAPPPPSRLPPAESGARVRRVLDASTGRVVEIDLDAYTEVPAWYILEVELGVEVASEERDSIPLRPEMFLLKRITWASAGAGLEMQDRTCTATTNEQPPVVTTTVCPGDPLSVEILGRSIRVSWSDEFTKFLGIDRSALISALFGDANGFLDFVDPILFQGKQAISAKFERVYTLPGVVGEQTELVQLVFHGTGLLPAGVNESGSL